MPAQGSAPGSADCRRDSGPSSLAGASDSWVHSLRGRRCTGARTCKFCTGLRGARKSRSRGCPSSTFAASSAASPYFCARSCASGRHASLKHFTIFMSRGYLSWVSIRQRISSGAHCADAASVKSIRRIAIEVARKRYGDIWGLCFHFCPARCSGHKRPPLGYAGCARNRDLQRQPLGSTGPRSAQMPRDACNTMRGMNSFPHCHCVARPIR
jgi:hypothetical protein